MAIDLACTPSGVEHNGYRLASERDVADVFSIVRIGDRNARVPDCLPGDVCATVEIAARLERKCDCACWIRVENSD